MTQPAPVHAPETETSAPDDAEMDHPQAEAVSPADAMETPSWFARTYHEQTPEDLAQAYDNRRRASERLAEQESVMPVRAASELEMTAFRRLLEERLNVEAARRRAMAMAPVTPPPAARPRPVAPRRAPLPLSELARTVPPRPPGAAAPAPRLKPAPGRGGLALAALAALLVGGMAGFGVAQRDQLAGWLHQAAARVAEMAPVTVAPPGPQPVTVAATPAGETKKPVEVVSLSVKNVEGMINDPIPLDVVARDSDLATPIALKVMGVPEKAYLTAGKELRQGEWLLQAADIGKASLVVPTTATPEIGLSVAAVEATSGELAAPMQEMTVAVHGPDAPALQTAEATAGQTAEAAAGQAPEAPAVQITPASGPPEQPADGKLAMTTAAPPSPEAEGLLQKGRMLLDAGDLAAARPFLTKAEAMGSGAAALALGQSYDPATFIRLKVQGQTPDVAEARNWYEKAKAAGVTEAEAALAALAKAGQP